MRDSAASLDAPARRRWLGGALATLFTTPELLAGPRPADAPRLPPALRELVAATGLPAASIGLQVQAVEQALKVPVSALFPSGARSALFAVELGRAHLREVEVLARNGEEALIKSSLGVGSEVVIYPPAKLKDGQRVRQLTAR